MAFRQSRFSKLLRVCETGEAHALAAELQECLPLVETLAPFQAGGHSSGAASTGAQQSVEALLRETLGVTAEVAQELLECAAHGGRARSAEAAAWHFFSERASMLSCLCFTLEVFLEYRDAPAAVVQHVTALLRHLVGREASAGTPTLLASLCAIAQQASEAPRSSALAHVVDRYGGRTRIEAALAHEQSVACQAIFLLTTARTTTRAPPRDGAALTALLGKLCSGSGAQAPPHAPAAHALLAFVTVVAPTWPSEAGVTLEDTALGELVRSQEMLQAVRALPAAAGSLCAVARLAFGMAGVATYEKADTDDVAVALGLISEALDASACATLETLVSSPAFHRQSEGVRARASAVLLGLLLRYAESIVNLSPTDDPARFQAANAFGHAAVARTARGTSLSRGFSLTPYPGASPGVGSGAAGTAEAAAAAGRDAPPSLLAALAAMLEVHAAAHGGRAAITDDLPAAAQHAFVSFVNFACKAPPLLEDASIADDPRRKGWGPPARAAYLRVLRAYACSATAAYEIVSQLVLFAQHDDYEHLSWQEYFKLMAGLHDRYLHVTAETRFATQDDRRDPATEDERIMAVAYTDLAAAVLTALKTADSAEQQAKAMAHLHDAMNVASPSHRANSPPELLLQVMCLAVPHELKASIDGFLAAHVSSPAGAVQLLNRLQAAEMVQSSQLGRNLTTQLRAVAESEEEYSEMVAYVRMINSIFEGAGAALVLEEHERLLQYTEFVVDPLLSSIGVRRYSRPEQLYELAEACLEHLCLCVRLMRECGAHSSAHPGNTALRHLLSPSSVLLHELLTHVLGASASLQPAAAERLVAMVQESAAGPAAERAVLKLFELLTTVCEGDEAWVDAQQRQQQAVAPLHSLIMRQPAWALQLVQFAEPGACPALQRAAVRMMGFLSTRDATFTHKLLRFQPRRLVYHCAATLAETLFDSCAPDDTPTTAGLLLHVMLDNVYLPFPNLAQLLLGYTVHQGEDALCKGPTMHGPACLTPLLPLLKLATVPDGAMGAYGAAWLLVHRVTSARWDGDVLLSRLLEDGTLVCALKSNLWKTLDSQDVQSDLRLRCKGWILDIAALALVAHTTSADSPQLRDATEVLLSALLGLDSSAPEGHTAGHIQADTALLSILEDLSLLQRCDIGRVWQAHQVSSAAMQALQASAVLDSSAATEDGGALVFDSTKAVWLYEGSALSALLHERLQAPNEGSSLTAASPAELESVLGAALDFAPRWNAWQSRIAGCCSLLKAWKAVVALVCCKHSHMCARLMRAVAGQEDAAMCDVCQSMIRAALQTALDLGQQEMRGTDVGLPLLPVSPCIIHLLQCAQGLLGHLGTLIDRPELPASFCYDTVVALLAIAQAVTENASLVDDRADVLMAVHTCLLTHFATASATGAGHERSPQSDRNGTATSRSSSAAASSDALHAQADIAAAHSAAVKSDDMGTALLTHLVATLAPGPEPHEAAATPLDTAATLARGDHRILALHAITALVAADASPTLAAGVRSTGVLAAVLDSLAALTERRLMASVQFQLQNFRLVEAHLTLLQAFLVPSNAALSVPACRELMDRGVIAAIRQSRILQLHVTPASADPAAVATRVARLRASTLRLLLTLSVQLRSSREALQEVAALVATDSDGCLGPRAGQVLALAATEDAWPLDLRQAEALTLIVSTITQCLESLNAKAEFSGAILGLRNACIDLLATLCTRAAQAPEAPTNGRDTTSFGPHTNGQSSQAIVLRSNAAGLPDSSDAADAAAPSVPVLLTSRCLDVLSAAAASTSDRVEIWPAQSNAEYLRRSNRFDVGHIFALLAWLLGAMRRAEERLHATQRADRSAALALPSTDGHPGEPPSRERSAAEARHIRRYLYHCSVLVERSVAAVAGCIRSVASHLQAAKANGGVAENERTMVQALLQQCAVLTSDWGSAVDSSGGGGLGDLLRCVKGGTVQLRDLCR